MEILTGNELISGATVYLDRRGQWVEELQEARVFAVEEGEGFGLVFADAGRLGGRQGKEHEGLVVEIGVAVHRPAAQGAVGGI